MSDANVEWPPNQTLDMPIKLEVGDPVQIVDGTAAFSIPRPYVITSRSERDNGIWHYTVEPAVPRPIARSV